MPEGIPTDAVLKLRAQGLSNNQIIQTLQRQGYSVQQMSDAMSQAEMKYTVEGAPISGEKMPEEPYYPENYPAGGESAQQPTFSAKSLQPIIEKIVEEKWAELLRDLEKLAAWKEKTDERLIKIESQLIILKDSFDRLHEGVLGQISEYDKSMKDVGINVKAMEDVFKKVLPGFVENVSELSRITQEMKKATAKK
jgi:hypothetical protein